MHNKTIDKPTKRTDMFSDRRQAERRQRKLSLAVVNNECRRYNDRRKPFDAMINKPWWLKQNYVDQEEIIEVLINKIP
jgi:hypothetical protein